MANDNKAKFSRILATLAEVYNRTLTPEMTAIYWSVFGNYPIAQIEQAARRHVETAKFFPSPAELLEYIPSARWNHHINADEAWAIVIESFDENTTVVMTREISEARGIVLPVWETGDDVGARMAFREAYTRIVKTSSNPPEWVVSEGFDKLQRADAVKNAVQLGRLSHDKAAKYIDSPKDGGAIGKLITGKVTEIPANNEKLKQHWAGLKQALIDGQERLEESERLAREKKRLDFEEKREAALRAVKEKIESK